jgi:hypothetical protein
MLPFQPAFQGGVMLVQNRVATIRKAPAANLRPISALNSECAGDVDLIFGKDVDSKPSTFNQTTV